MKRKAKQSATAPTTISNCNFTGVHWDANAVASIQTVAQALLNLTELFQSQGMSAPLISVGADAVTVSASRDP